MDSLFQFHKLNADGQRQAAALAESFDSLLTTIRPICEKNAGREFALVRTHLELACTYAKKCVALRAENHEVP